MSVAVPTAWHTRTTAEQRATVLEQHRRLAQAIADKDSAAAVVEMNTHFDTSIGDLFLAGFLPGLIIITLLYLVSRYFAKKHGYGAGAPKASWRERWQALRRAGLTLLMPVVVLGGIYGGIFTPTEAAGVAVRMSVLYHLLGSDEGAMR